jgi:hypothetical protein
VGSSSSNKSASSAKARARAARIQAEHVEAGFGAIIGGAAGGGVVQQRVAGDLRFLRHHGDADAGLGVAAASVRLDGADQHLHQRRFAGPVAPHKAGAHSRVDS